MQSPSSVKSRLIHFPSSRQSYLKVHSSSLGKIECKMWSLSSVESYLRFSLHH